MAEDITQQIAQLLLQPNIDPLRAKGLMDLAGQMRAAQAIGGRPRSLRDEAEGAYISDLFPRGVRQ